MVFFVKEAEVHSIDMRDMVILQFFRGVFVGFGMVPITAFWFEIVTNIEFRWQVHCSLVANIEFIAGMIIQFSDWFRFF